MNNELLRRKIIVAIKLFILGLLLFGVQDVQGKAKTGTLYQKTAYLTENDSVNNLYKIESDFPVDLPVDEILDHISIREKVAPEELKIINVVKKSFENLGKEYWFVKVENLNTFITYETSVGISDGDFIDDYQALDRAEQDAYFAKYGVLKKTLYERLQSIKDEDLVPVGIWIIATPKYTEEEVFAALANQYPEAQASLEESGNPFDIDNRDLLHQIENEYTSRMIEGIQAQLQPIINLLSERGYSASFTEGMPAITATLPKSIILELASRADVGSIGLVDQEIVETMDSALYSDRAPVVWARGYRGGGVHIGILERGKLNFQFVRQGAIRTPACNTEPVSGHKVSVGNIAAAIPGTDPTPGIAPDAYVDDACSNGTVPDIVSGLYWAAVTNNSDPINYSAAFRYTYQQEYLDMAFDYWARIGIDNPSCYPR